MRADFTLDGTASRKAVGFLKRLIPDRSPQHAAGDMTEEKRLTAAELFAKYDEDGSNSIDADELDLMLKECGHKPDKETAKLLLSEHVDGMEEELSFEQFSALLRVLDTRALFDKYDADGSGTIDEGELQTMLESCGHATDAGGAKGLLDEFSEGKGELTKLQFANVLKKLDVDDASRRGIIGDPAADGAEAPAAAAATNGEDAEAPAPASTWDLDEVQLEDPVGGSAAAPDEGGGGGGFFGLFLFCNKTVCADDMTRERPPPSQEPVSPLSPP